MELHSPGSKATSDSATFQGISFAGFMVDPQRQVLLLKALPIAPAQHAIPAMPC